MRLPPLLALSLFAGITSARGAVVTESASAPPSPREGIRWGALPIANYSSDQGATLGAMAQRFDYGGDVRPFRSLITAQLSFAQRGPKNLFLSYERTGVGERQWRLRGDLSLYDNRSQRYYGLGSDSRRASSADSQGLYSYRQRQATLELSARRTLLALPEPDFATRPGLDLQVGAGGQAYSATSNNAASVFATDFGPESEAVYGYLFARLILERRDSEFIPSRGVYALAGLRLAPGASDHLGAWARFDLDLRHYHSFLENRWLWLATQLRYAAASSDAPLQEKARLGSLGTVRGFALNRFMDSQSLGLRTELRSVTIRLRVFDLPLKVGHGIFADAGRVGASLPSLGRAPTVFTWGFSLFGSYFTDDFLGSADIGFSPEGTQFYFSLGHAF